MQRRNFLKMLGAGGLIAGLPLGGALAGAAPKVVIVGGGAGGATAAKYLKLFNPAIDVLVVEKNPIYLRPFGSSEVLNGHEEMADLEVGYDTLRSKYGIRFLFDTVTGVDADARVVHTAGGEHLRYDRMIVSPGIEQLYERIEGHSRELADSKITSGWQPGAQTQLLRDQLHSMRQGGTFAIVTPSGPYRCPPGPYERGALMAEWFQRHNPRAKVIILDNRDNFVPGQSMLLAWNRLYGYNIPADLQQGMPTDGEWPMREHSSPGMLDWVRGRDGGRILRVDASNMTVETEGDIVKADVINIIPPMIAGRIAQTMGLTDGSGFCPIDRRSHESSIHPNIHVIGDACVADAMPKSGYAANTQAKVAARAVVDLLAGRDTAEPLWENTCYALGGMEYGLYVADVFRLRDERIARVDGPRFLPLDASRAQIRLGALYQKNWMRTFVDDCFA